MGSKLKYILVICIIFLSTLIVGWNFNSNANNFDDETNTSTTSRFIKYSRAGDFDWGSIEPPSEPIFGQNYNVNNSNEPKVAVYGDKIYVIWKDDSNFSNAGVDKDIFYRHFDGNSWSDIQVISEPVFGQNYNTRSSLFPDIAVENGKVYVVWSDYNEMYGAGLDPDIFYRCNLTGKNWEDIQVISEPIPGQNINIGGSGSPRIDVENDRIYVVWYDDNNTNGAGADQDIFYRCNITGENWENIQVISEPVKGYNFNNKISTRPEIAVENGKIYAVWEDYSDINLASSASPNRDIFFVCNITGYSWGPIQVISEPVFGKDLNVVDSEHSSIDVDNGNIFVVWEDQNETNGAGTDHDISYRCNLTGSNWEDIQVISEPSQGYNYNIRESHKPDIDVENGRIYVVWSDRNWTNNAGQNFDIFYRSNFTGYSWESTQVISEPIKNKDLNTNNSKNPHIIVHHGKSHIVWRDVDIFYRWIKDPSPLFINNLSLTPNFGYTETIFNYSVTYFNYEDNKPTQIKVIINEIENLMKEVDPSDDNFIDGKNYFFEIDKLDVKLHNYQFYATDGTYDWRTKIYHSPIVLNTEPLIITQDNITAYEDLYYEIKYEYEDIDIINIDQSIIWNFSTDAEWLTFDKSTALLNGTPTNDDVGEYWLNISINDTMASDLTNFTLTVINVNDAPVIITEDVKAIIEDEYYENYFTATDIDSPQESLFWNMYSNASWLDFESSTAKLSGTPENDDVGEFWISISVSDGQYLTYSNFTLKVINVNDPPRIITKDNTTALEDEFYEMIYKAEDVDNTQNELIWEINTNAKWLNYNIPTAAINGTPTNEDVGEYWVNISVSDNELIDFTNFTLSVINTNDPPSIITKDKINTTVGELYSINYEANDIDPPPLTFTWSIKTNTSDWLTIDSINGWLNGIPSVDDAGIYWVNVTVIDGENGLDFHNFSLRVLEKPIIIKKRHAPRLSNASMTPLAGNDKTEFTFSVHYYDEDGEVPIFIEVVIDGDDHELKLKAGENASNGTYEYSITLSEGTHNYYFIAYDGSETVKTGNYTTLEIKKMEVGSQEMTSLYWVIWIIIIIVTVIILAMVLSVYKKRKAPEIPTLKAELIQAPVVHSSLPSATPSVIKAELLVPKPIVSEQLPTPTVQAQPAGEKVHVPTLAPAPVGTQFQLPQATLTKAQRLGLLQERFLRGEVTEEMYKELKGEIESMGEKEISVEDAEEQTEQSLPDDTGPETTQEESQIQTQTPDLRSEQLLDQVTQLGSPLEPQIIEPTDKEMEIKAPETTTPEPEQTEIQTVSCPICKNQIRINATPCPHCGSELNW